MRISPALAWQDSQDGQKGIAKQQLDKADILQLIGITQSERVITMAPMPGITDAGATKDKVLAPTIQRPSLRDQSGS